MQLVERCANNVMVSKTGEVLTSPAIIISNKNKDVFILGNYGRLKERYISLIRQSEFPDSFMLLPLPADLKNLSTTINVINDLSDFEFRKLFFNKMVEESDNMIEVLG